MRHLLALFALSLVLVACDESTTPLASNLVATDSIPSAPNPPRLAVTVLTGTKAAPVDSPTVRVQWWYKDSVQIVIAMKKNYANDPLKKRAGIGDSVFTVSCEGMDSDSASVGVMNNSVSTKYASTTVAVYCK